MKPLIFCFTQREQRIQRNKVFGKDFKQREQRNKVLCVVFFVFLAFVVGNFAQGLTSLDNLKECEHFVQKGIPKIG